MSELIGHMVVHNEYDRYLTKTLPALAELCDGRVVVVDDFSTDETWDWINDSPEAEGWQAFRRPDDVPSFLEHEGKFREWAWIHAAKAAGAEAGDWIISLDADEFVVASSPSDTYRLIREAMNTTDGQSFEFKVLEVFDDSGEVPMVRTDGFWGSISSHRLARWHPDSSEFLMMKMGCGSIPHFAKGDSRLAIGLAILHFGYARPEDRLAKYARYRRGGGHNRSHVESILREPKLQTWAVNDES